MSVLPAPRSPHVQDRPPLEGSRIVHGSATSVHEILRRLIKQWRDDPDRLAVAIAAYRLAGYWYETWEVAEGWPYKQRITDDEARELVDKALYRRNRRVLRNRAEGLLWALEELAQEVEAFDLHQRQVESCVIECRVLPIDERIAALKAKETI